MVKLPELHIIPKTGKEKFTLTENSLDIQLNEFWSWNQSNLVENRTRGILAEFIVKKAPKVRVDIRVEWDNYDLVSHSGNKIEVKSAAYIQSWEQKSFSNITFGISKSTGSKDHPDYDGKYRRWSDFYIFCLLKHKEQKTINPLNLDQWTFYILKTEVLNTQVPEQKSISLSSLLKLNPNKCSFQEISSIIE